MKKSEMSFTITAHDKPKDNPIKKKKKAGLDSPRDRSTRESKEDQDAVNAAKDKLRKLKNKNKKANRAVLAPRSAEEAEIIQEIHKKKNKNNKKDLRKASSGKHFSDLDSPADVEYIEDQENRSASKALVSNDVKAKKRISKLNRKELVSIIGDDAEEMQNLFEDGSTDQAIQLLNRRLIQTCIDLIPQLETGIRNSNGRYGVHSLNGTIQTIRELVIDLQQMQDRGAIGQSIVDTILRPTMLEIATKIVEEQATVLSEVKDSVPEESYKLLRQAQIDSRNRLGSTMNERFEFMKDEIVKYLQR